jgi:hypothetical protein
MPDVSGLPALDVLIGIVFLFFLLSIVCAAINETIASMLAWRAKNLERAVRNMLKDPKGETGTNLTQHLYDNARIRPYSRRPDKPFDKRRLPSYLPPKAFAAALLDVVAPTVAQRRDPDASAGPVIDAVQYEGLKGELNGFLAKADMSVGDYRKELEAWFNEVMERASGWYRRKVQIALWVIAVVVVCAVNADSFQTASRLWNDDALRTSVVAAAQARAEKENQQVGTVADAIDDVNELHLPLGWGDANVPDDLEGWVGKGGGWLVTVIALSLGAPFWFDLLGNLSQLRGTGTRRQPEAED